MTTVSKVELGGRVFRAEVLSLPAPSKDQDAWRIGDDFVAVADGATPLDDQPAPAVREYAAAALNALEARRTETAEGMVRGAVDATRQMAVRHVPPLSCTVALARTVADGIQIVVLGDCIAVVADAQGRRRTIRDPRLTHVDGGVVDKLTSLTLEGMPFDEASRAISGDLVENRMRMNRRDSYWSFSSAAEAGKHILRRVRGSRSISAMLLCSDGFARLADTYRVTAGTAGLLELCETKGLATLGRELRAIEGEPDSLTRYPRFSRHDDATAVLLTADGKSG